MTNWIFQTSYHFTYVERQFAQPEGYSEFKGKEVKNYHLHMQKVAGEHLEL